MKATSDLAPPWNTPGNAGEKWSQKHCQSSKTIKTHSCPIEAVWDHFIDQEQNKRQKTSRGLFWMPFIQSLQYCTCEKEKLHRDISVHQISRGWFSSMITVTPDPPLQLTNHVAVMSKFCDLQVKGRCALASFSSSRNNIQNIATPTSYTDVMVLYGLKNKAMVRWNVRWTAGWCCISNNADIIQGSWGGDAGRELSWKVKLSFLPVCSTTNL